MNPDERKALLSAELRGEPDGTHRRSMIVTALAVSVAIVSMAWSWIDVTTLRHELHAERRARCAAELQVLVVSTDPAVIDTARSAIAGGGPEYPCDLVREAVRHLRDHR